jgi:hypothetical protein
MERMKLLNAPAASMPNSGREGEGMVLNRIDVFCRECGRYLYVGEPPIKENPMCDTCSISTLAAQLAEAKAEVERLERLLITETPTEEHREEALKVVKRYGDEYRNLQAALEKIRDEHGKVCNEYEVCTHISCASSHAAWTIAEQALKG